MIKTSDFRNTTTNADLHVMWGGKAHVTWGGKRSHVTWGGRHVTWGGK